jgi:hypothetical protein
MPFLIALVVGLIGWAYWTGKIKAAQLPPILLGMAGAGLAVKGLFLPGIAIIGVAVTWYRGLTWRLFGLNTTQSPEYHLSNARYLLGASAHDDADTIRARHRKLIAANHPDVGGNEDRASALNEARDLLLADLAKQNR